MKGENPTAGNEVVAVERMCHGPEAVGRLRDGMVVFVDGAAPGDLVRIELAERHASFARGRVVEVLQPGPGRVRPQCACAGECGGCPWAHLSYEAQLAAKRDGVVAALVRTAGFSEDDARATVAPCISSERRWGYRNKLELAAGEDAAGRLRLGFARKGSHDLVTPPSCPVAASPACKAPKALQGALRFLSQGQGLGVFRVGVRASLRTGDVEVALWTRPGAFPRAQAARTLGDAVRATSIVRVLAEPGKERKVKGVEVLAGKGHWDEEMGGCSFSVSAPSFFQVNTEQAERLVDAVLDGLGDVSGALVADLYAGGGTFSLPLAKAGAEVLAVEAASSSVRDLRRNAKRNHAGIGITGGDALRELPRLGGLDALVVDPPRAGLAQGAAEAIAAASPGRVAYVSCDPATWARDVARLEGVGYRLARAQPVDLFPQTFHVETVSVFVRE